MVATAALLVTGCRFRTFDPDKPSGGGNHHGSDNPPSGQLTERTDWKIDYKGRADYKEENGSVTRVEEFSFKYTGNGYFIVRTFAPEDLSDYYDNDLKKMIDEEVDYVVSQAENEDRKFYENTSSVFDSNVRNMYFELIIHGDYTAYMIEIGKNGKPTYHYAKTAMHVDEETPVQDYLQWIGSWYVTDGKVGYNIEVSSCEANYFYYVDGWETGESVEEQMTMERDWIFARYRNGALYFYGQYLMSYEDESLQDDNGDNVWVDQMFVGTYLSSSSDSNGQVDAEGAYYGYDIAHTVRLDGGKVIIEPERFTFDNGLDAVYHSMRYSRFCYDNSTWAHYNYSGVPTFTGGGMTMDPIPGTRAHRDHLRTKSLFRRTQPKAHNR